MRSAWLGQLFFLLLATSCVRHGTTVSPSDARQLAPADEAFRQGNINEGLRRFAIVKPKLPPIVARHFIAKHEPGALAELAARDKRGERGSAYVLAFQVAAVFESKGAQTRLAELGARWKTDLNAAITKHEQAKHPATAVLLRAARAAVTRESTDASSARNGLAELAGKHRLGVDARGDAASVLASLSRDRRFDPSGRDVADRVQLTFKQGQPTNKKDVKRETKRAQIEQGTRSVPNPEREQLEIRIADHEDRIVNLREQKQAEQESPSRSQGALDAFDYQIQVEQGDLDEAREWHRQMPATVEVPNVVDYDYEVEIHTLTVSRDVELEVKFASGGESVVLRETVRVAKSDQANAAHPKIGLAKDGVNLPDQRGLMPDLDQAVEKWSVAAGDKIYAAYRSRVLAAASDRGEGLALYSALGAGSIDAAQATELEQLSGIPQPDRVLSALERGAVQTAFEPAAPAPKATAVASTTKPGASMTKPCASTTSRPGASTTSKSGASTTAASTTTVESGTKPAKPDSTKPAPAAPKPDPDSDAVRAKAGRSIAIAALEIRRGTKVIALVDRAGQVQARGQVTGQWRANGVLEDPKGRALLAVDKSGTVWINDKGVKKTARLQGGTLVLETGITIAIDGAGHVVLTRGKEREISHETIVPASKQDLALLVSMLVSGLLRFAKAP